MIWQDWSFTIGSLILTIGILPMVKHQHKPPLSSSIPVVLVLAVFCINYVTLGFVAAPIIESLQTLLWGVLVVQRWREDSFMRSMRKIDRENRRAGKYDDVIPNHAIDWSNR